MNRRSFLSVSGLAPLLRLPLWGQEPAAPAVAWGPPRILWARGEHRRAVVSFTPVRDAAAYVVRCRPTEGDALTTEGVLVTDYTILGLENGRKYSVSAAATGPNGMTAWSNEVAVTPSAEMDWDTIEKAFTGANPTRSSCPFWMIHGNETDEELRSFLDVAYRFGFEGVTLHPYNYEDFLGEGEWSRFKVIVDHALKLGLAVWQQDDKNYPSGYAAGTIVKKDPSLARWEIVLAGAHRKHGPAEMDIPLAVPEHQGLVSVSAFGPADSVEDLTAQASGATLHWSVPDGAWSVYVTAARQPEIHPPDDHPNREPAAVRGYIDPLSEKATDLYVDAISGATFRHLGGEFGRTWRGFFIDEPGFYNHGNKLGQHDGGYPYTPDFLERFQQKYGYSLQPLLPMLWVSHGKLTQRVRRDYMDFVGSEYSRLFIGKLTRFAESHGIQITGHVREDATYELGPGTGGDFRTLEYFSMGGFDHIFDQWYVPEEDVYWRQPKMASSISHYLETPEDEAMVEHFAATGWRTGLTEMKAMMNWTTCRGLNHIVPCGLDTQEQTVWEDAPEFWLHGANPLAPYFHTYQTAVNRDTMMIRGGRHVAKALVLDPAESSWAGQVESLWRVNKTLSQAHFDYDNASYYVFTDPAKCRIDGKRILLGHEDYEFLVLPGVDAIPPKVLQRVVDFYTAGGTVLIIGPGLRLDRTMKYLPRVPFCSTDGQSDAEVQRLAAAIWGPDAKGPGRVFLTGYRNVANLLYSLDEHDVWVEPNLTMLQYYHRRRSGRDLYFFNNEGEAARTEVRLRGAKGVPEFWNSVDGTVRQAPCYRVEGDWLCVRLELDRYESVFVVVNPTTKPQPHVAMTDADSVCRTAAGKVSLRKYGRGAIHYANDAGKEQTWETPARELRPVSLSDRWTRTPTEGNGAVYRVQFDAPGTQGAELRIDGMTQVIRAKVNGRDLGMRYTQPFRFDLGTGLKPSQNALELLHVERHTFQSEPGKVSITPYYSFEV